MGKLIDLVGKKFSRLMVIRRVNNKGREAVWECECDCGNTHEVMGRNLRNGTTKSCGCYNREKPKTHGMSGTKIYQAWKSIVNRCNGFTEGTRKIYKEKGITVCDRWSSFENFRDDMLESYKEHVEAHGKARTTLDRIDGSKGYFLENCRWATYQVQARNRSFRNKNPGVVFKSNKWVASIGFNGRDIHLGTFEIRKDAIEARNKAEEKYWGND